MGPRIDSLLFEIINRFGEVDFITDIKGEKTVIKEFPFPDINVDIKRYNSGLFVVRLSKFQFFNRKLIDNYLKKNLPATIEANFIVSSENIYIYPRNRKDVMSCVNALDESIQTIREMIKKIENALI